MNLDNTENYYYSSSIIYAPGKQLIGNTNSDFSSEYNLIYVTPTPDVETTYNYIYEVKAENTMYKEKKGYLVKALK